MLKDFGEAAGLDDSLLSFVSAQITWWDAMGDDDRSPMLGTTKRNHTTAASSGSDAASTTTSGPPTSPRWGVSGGRLGRDHTFADVPSHYARDRLMHYTVTQLDSDKHDRVFAALCPDLNQAQIAIYSKCIAEDRVMSEEDEGSGPGLEDGESEGQVPRERDGNRGTKRASQGGEHGGGKETKTGKGPRFWSSKTAPETRQEELTVRPSGTTHRHDECTLITCIILAPYSYPTFQQISLNIVDLRISFLFSLSRL